MVKPVSVPFCRVHFIIGEQKELKGTRLTGSTDCCPLSRKPFLEDCANCSAILPERKYVFISKRTYQKYDDFGRDGLSKESRCDLTISYWPDGVSCTRGPSSYKCGHFPSENDDEDFDFELDYTPDCSICHVIHKSRTQMGLLSQAGLKRAMEHGGYSYMLHVFPDPFSVFPASNL